MTRQRVKLGVRFGS